MDRQDGERVVRCASGPRLRIVSATLKGHDNIDVAACTQRGIWLTILPHELTEPTAELGVSLTLGVLRRVSEGEHHVRSGAYAGWRPRFYGKTLAGKIVGIIGMGAVGRALATRLQALRARIVYADRSPLPATRAAALGARRSLWPSSSRPATSSCRSCRSPAPPSG